MATKSPEKQKVVQIQRWQIGLNVLVQLLTIAVILLFVNYLSFRHFKRWDFSRDKQYALSSQTRNVLGNLQKPVQAIIFFSSAAELLPDLNNLLREYTFAGNKKFVMEAVDPYRNLARAEELANKYKIQANDNIVILDYDGRSKFVNAADMVEMEAPDQMQQMMGQQAKMKAFKGESAITGALMELTAGKANKIYLLGGHGEADLNGPDFRYFGELLKRQNIQTAPLNLLNTDKVPDDARSLIINGPKYDYSELEMKLINDFWAKKGSLMVFLNPFAKTPRLAAWLGEQGVTAQDDRVIGVANFMSMNEKTGLPEFTKGVTQNAAFVVPENGSPIIKDIAGVTKQLLGTTQSLKLNQEAAKALQVRLTPLMESAEGFWGETDLATDLTKAIFEPKSDHAGPLPIAASVERGAMEDPRMKVDTARLIVIGNSEFLNDKEYRTSEGVTGDFAVSGLNWLLAHEESIGIPPKEKKTVTINLSPVQLRNIALIVMLAIPGFVALMGILTWSMRRS